MKNLIIKCRNSKKVQKIQRSDRHTKDADKHRTLFQNKIGRH